MVRGQHIDRFATNAADQQLIGMHQPLARAGKLSGAVHAGVNRKLFRHPLNQALDTVGQSQVIGANMGDDALKVPNGILIPEGAARRMVCNRVWIRAIAPSCGIFGPSLPSTACTLARNQVP